MRLSGNQVRNAFDEYIEALEYEEWPEEEQEQQRLSENSLRAGAEPGEEAYD